jgi:hypothetical protein
MTAGAGVVGAGVVGAGVVGAGVVGAGLAQAPAKPMANTNTRQIIPSRILNPLFFTCFLLFYFKFDNQTMVPFHFNFIINLLLLSLEHVREPAFPPYLFQIILYCIILTLFPWIVKITKYGSPHHQP